MAQFVQLWKSRRHVINVLVNAARYVTILASYMHAGLATRGSVHASTMIVIRVFTA